MSREYNYGGTSLIVDSIEELFENGAVQTKTVSNIKQVIGLQRQSKDINKLKEQIEAATDDGVITVSEKPGLKREWASLESSYATISDKFTQDDTLKENSLFYVLKARFNELSPIMDEIFADMNSSYKNAEKVSKLTTLFVDCWEYITLCSQLLETKLSISDRFSLQISPAREIVGPLDIRVTLLYLTNGIYSDVTNQSTYLDSDFVWKKTSDENFERTGRVLSLTLDDMSSNEEQFMLTFKHTFTYEDPNATDVVIAKSISFAVSTGTLSQWTWSDAATKEELLLDPFAIWLDYRREFNTKKYLWRRDTNDLLKTDSEKEWLYFRESGLDGLIGSNGYSRAVLELFKRSETTPASFDGGVITYTFSTNAISGDTGTWQKTIPNGEHPLYIIKATAFANTETDSISTGEWTTPAILSEHGTDGSTGATTFALVLYQRSSEKPAKPTEEISYNVKTGALAPSDVVGDWINSFPNDNGLPCWAINTTAFTYTDVATIDPSKWSEVAKLVESGTDGKDAIQPKYQWRLSKSSTEPPADTIIYGDGGVYSSFDGALLVSAVDGWSDVKPSSTPEYPYIWERVSSDGGLTWGIPYCLTTIPVEALLVSASPSTFMLNDRRHCPESQTVIITVDRSSISSENECYIRVYRDGVMDDTEDGTGESKYNGISFSVDIPKNATTHKIEVEVSCGTHSKSVVISATYPEKAIPQRVRSLAATNNTFYVADGNLYADENLSLLMTHIDNDSSMPFVDGDYALCYVFDDEGTKKTIPYRYSSMSASWQVATSTDSNSADIMFGTLEDALKDKDVAIAQTSIHLAFIETLVASNAFISNLVIKKAIESTPFKWTDSEKIGFRIDAETGEIKANGMETVGMRAINATIQGNITHDSLVTVDNSGADENTAISKTGTKDMWLRGDVFADLMKIDEGFPYRSMMSDISGNFNRLGIINSSYYKGSLSGSYNGSTQSLDYYAYSSSSNIAAGDNEHVCGKFKNNTGTYVLTYYEYNLDGVNNAIYLKVYDENDNYVIGTGLANESHSGYIYLPPGYTVTIKGMSTALWGNKTGSGAFIFLKSSNTLPPYRFQHDYSYNYEYTSNDSGILPAMYDGTIRTLSAYESDSSNYRDGSSLMYEFTAGPYTKYAAFFTAIAYAATSVGSSAGYSVYINNVKTSPVGKIYGHDVYAVTPNANIRVYGSYVYTEETDEEGNTTTTKHSDMFIGGMTLAEYVDNPVYYTDRYGAYVHRDDGGALFYSINDNTYLLGTDSQKPVLTSPSYSPSYKKISGAQIVSAITSSVSKNKVIFVTGTSAVNVSGTSNVNNLVSILATDSSVRFDFSDRAAIIINSSDTLDSFSCQFTILKTKAHIVLGMVEPKDSSIHIGTKDNRFNKVWSKDIDANGNLIVNGANHTVSIENGTITANKVWGAVFN